MATQRFRNRSPRGHLTAEILHWLEIRGLDVPPLGGALRGGKVRDARDGPAPQLDPKDALATGAGTLVENAESIVGEHTLHYQLALLQLLSRNEIARRTSFRPPNDRHCLEILSTDRGQKLLDGRAWRRSARERTAGPRTARRKDQDEPDDRTLHDVSPSYL